MAPSASTPLVTIVTPAYNRAALLRQTIESVLAQDYPAIEYIVIDDGSTDETAEVLKEYGPRLIAVSQDNCGEQQTVNRGWSMASGEFICTLNDDDLLYPGAVSEAVAAFQKRPELMVVYPDFQLIDGDSLPIRDVKVPEFNFEEMLRTVSCYPGPGAFFRRSILERVGGRDTRFRYIADCEHWFRISLVGPMARLPLTLAAHRVHDKSLSIRYANVMMDELQGLVDHLFDNLELPRELSGLRREAFSHALAITATVRHRWSYSAALAGFCQSFAMSPLAWRRWPLRHLVRIAARIALPHQVLMPSVEFCRRMRIGVVRRGLLRRPAPFPRPSSSVAPLP